MDLKTPKAGVVFGDAGSLQNDQLSEQINNADTASLDAPQGAKGPSVTRFDYTKLDGTARDATRTSAFRIRARLRSVQEHIIEIGRDLISAREALGHGLFLKWVAIEFEMSDQTAYNYINVAECYGDQIPNGLENRPALLYVLSAPSTPQSVRDVVVERVQAGERVTRDDVLALKKSASAAAPPSVHTGGSASMPSQARVVTASRQEPNDSRDYFPTPPWATRALIECVFLHLGVAVHRLDTALEPACGEGHMAEVLSEYFQQVFATDLHEYGYGPAGVDFTDQNTAIPEVDWIINNPPFGDLASKFITRALDHARVGVAMFLQLRYLEGKERYDLIFKERPPTLLAPFVERVPLHRERWEPDGDTMSAYCWLVWIKGKSPLPPFWIPPGCKASLSKPDDCERFTAHPVIRKEHDLAVLENRFKAVCPEAQRRFLEEITAKKNDGTEISVPPILPQGEAVEESNAAASFDPKQQNRGTRLSANWQPSARCIAYALDRGMSRERTMIEAEKFQNYWTAKSGQSATKRDWEATWRNWILTTLERGNGIASNNRGGRSDPASKPAATGADATLAGMARLARRLDERRNSTRRGGQMADGSDDADKSDFERGTT